MLKTRVEQSKEYSISGRHGIPAT